LLAWPSSTECWKRDARTLSAVKTSLRKPTENKGKLDRRLIHATTPCRGELLYLIRCRRMTHLTCAKQMMIPASEPLPIEVRVVYRYFP
jgi:hypothetical protein